MSSKSFSSFTKGIFKKRSYNAESLEDISVHLKKGNFQNILVIMGPGSSSGTYSPDLVSLERTIAGYRKSLENHQDDSFSLRNFLLNPDKFFSKVEKLYDILTDCKPSFTHFFLTQLQNSGMLLRIYTLNVDGLEKIAGISEEKIIYLNGSLYSSHCSNKQCRTKYNSEFVKKSLLEKEIPICLKCSHPVKPDVKFSEERVYYDDLKSLIRDSHLCDLFMVIGSSLSSPCTGEIVKMITNDVSGSISTIYINTEQPKLKTNFSIRVIDECDNAFQILSRLVEWDDKLATLERNFYNKSLQTS